MQRILSGERARCVESSEEFVTKKLCLSFMIVCAFFSVLGGFFLGRYAAGRISAKKSAAETKPHIEAINQLSISVNKINNLTFALSILPASATASFNYGELYSRLKCSDRKVIMPDFDSFKDNVNLGAFNMITIDLGALQTCYENASIFLETVLFPD